MSPRRLLALYPRSWRRRYGAELAEMLGHERLSARLVFDLVRGAFDAHLHPELAAPVLAAAGGGTIQVPPRSPRARTLVLAVVLLLFLVYGGLYAVRSQSPAPPQVPVTEAVSEVQAGRVSMVVFEDSDVTLTLVDGARQRVAVDGWPDTLSTAIATYNDANPSRRVQVAYQTRGPSILAPLSAIVLTLLPIALLVLLVLLLARGLSRGVSHPRSEMSRYEWLARIADLRDRGVLTEEEFQREKKRLLE